MHSDSNLSTPRPANAFHPGFLSHLTLRGEVSTAPEAELAGPWEVRPIAAGFGVFRQWEEPEPGGAGDEPEAVFEHREHALLLASVLAGTGREPLFELRTADEPEGYAVESVWGDRWVATVGRLRRFQPDLVDALHVAEALVRSPTALAHLLEAAGPTALELAGRVLCHRLEEDGEEPG